MAELRWILLGIGVALIFFLWWWETRKARASANSTETWPVEPVDSLEQVAEESVGEEDASTFTYAPTIERVRVPRRPPLIEIPDDLEVDVSDFVGIDRRRHVEPEFTLEPEPGMEPDVADAANEEGLLQEEGDQPDDHHRAPWIRTQPLERDEIAPGPDNEPVEPPPADAIERRTAEASKQRIVALRLVATGEGWGGADLLSALEGEGLSFGPYSIFHREREDGKSLLFVASMMEPGSFDFAHMEEEVFSGISLFGVVPGPLDAPSTFDLVLSVGRGLADRLKGQLQDEQGSTLTSQRILNLREELVHFEHRNRRLRRT